MINCKDCKFWLDEGYKYEHDHIMHPLDLDTYEEMKMPFEVRKCKHTNITLFERNPNRNGVSLCDGSNYRAVMYTGPNFGCVNGEGK